MLKNRKLLPLVVALALAGLAGGGVQTAGAQNGGGMGFLRIDGIKGESTATGHEGEIEIESWSFSETNQDAGGGGKGGGGGAGKVQMGDFNFTAKYSKASPQLFLACAQGRLFKNAVFTLERGGTRPSPYLVVTFTDLFITRYQTGGSSSDVPTDSFSINFSKIVWDYTDARGDHTTAGWDVNRNSPA